MEIEGKIILVLPEESGTSRAGNAWHKKSYVLETQETYPKKVYFSFLNDRANQFPMQVGQQIRLSFDIDSREWTGADGRQRWSVEIRPWKVDYLDGSAPAAAPGAPQQYPGQVPPPPAYGATAPAAPQQYPGQVPPPPAMPASGPSDDLPF